MTIHNHSGDHDENTNSSQRDVSESESSLGVLVGVADLIVISGILSPCWEDASVCTTPTRLL